MRADVMAATPRIDGADQPDIAAARTDIVLLGSARGPPVPYVFCRMSKILR
jgi:hypothetical protein